MRTQKNIILTRDEAFDLLANWHADTIINDRQNVLDHVKSGELFRLAPDLTKYDNETLTEQIGDLNLAEKLVYSSDIQQVLVEVGGGDRQIVVWDRGNLSPDDIRELDAEITNAENYPSYVDEDGYNGGDYSPAWFDERANELEYLRSDGW